MSDAPSPSPSDHDVLESTGRHPDEWFAFLDMAGAANWQNSEIVAWFAENANQVSTQWAQAVSRRYAEARGLPLPE